jgi:hypothetical protein
LKKVRLSKPDWSIEPGTGPASVWLMQKTIPGENQNQTGKKPVTRPVWRSGYYIFCFQYFFLKKNIKKAKIRNKLEKEKKNMILIKILQSYDFSIYHDMNIYKVIANVYVLNLATK